MSTVEDMEDSGDYLGDRAVGAVAWQPVRLENPLSRTHHRTHRS